MMPSFGPSILGAPPEVDVVQGLDIAEINEQGVASMRSVDAECEAAITMAYAVEDAGLADE